MSLKNSNEDSDVSQLKNITSPSSTCSKSPKSPSSTSSIGSRPQVVPSRKISETTTIAGNKRSPPSIKGSSTSGGALSRKVNNHTGTAEKLKLFPGKEITFRDLCIKDKLRLREICLTLGKLEQEKNEIAEAKRKENREQNEVIEKLKKQNENLQKEASSLTGKLHQNSMMIRTYQTKIEEMISDNVELKRKSEEDRLSFKTKVDDFQQTINALKEGNANLQMSIEQMNEASADKPELVEKAMQTIELDVEKTLGESMRMTQRKEEVLKREYTTYLTQQSSSPTRLSSGCNSVSSRSFTNDVLKKVDEEENEEDEEDSTYSDEDSLGVEYFEQYFLAKPTTESVDDGREKPIEREDLTEESDTDTDSSDGKSIFSEDSLLDVVQLLEEQQSFEKMSIERRSMDTLSEFDKKESHEQLTGSLWFANQN